MLVSKCWRYLSCCEAPCCRKLYRNICSCRNSACTRISPCEESMSSCRSVIMRTGSVWPASTASSDSMYSDL